MSIKCTELPGATIYYETNRQVLVNRFKEGSYTVSPINYTRILQLRKRSLTSMGWRYRL